jgi:UDPglucose--hexose-1-phosphate uridylyltransferase
VIERAPITGEPVILAPAREQRPNVFEGAPCPFCPGAEELTPPEIARDGEPWRVRVFPNRYPPTDHAEVIVETANHEEGFEELDPAHAQRVVEIYAERYSQLAASSAYVCIFKNHGQLAGASIPHSHSQVVGTPFVPPRVSLEGGNFRLAEHCPLCEGSTFSLIAETEHYRWVAPAGARLAWQQWIVPKSHENELTQPRELAFLMQSSVRAMRTLSDAYNWSFQNFPHEPRGHWYLELFPRIARIAGFELGTGSFVNTIEASETAGVFRRFIA